MFVQLSGAREIRSSAPVASVQDVSTGALVDVDMDGLGLVVYTQGWTTGSCAVQARGSSDGNTFYDLASDQAVTLSRNGQAHLFLKRGVPRYLTFRLTPSGGFDGRARLVVRTDSFVQG